MAAIPGVKGNDLGRSFEVIISSHRSLGLGNRLQIYTSLVN